MGWETIALTEINDHKIQKQKNHATNNQIGKSIGSNAVILSYFQHVFSDEQV